MQWLARGKRSMSEKRSPVRHKVEDHGVPHALGVNRDVCPTRDILALQEVTEESWVLRKISMYQQMSHGCVSTALFTADFCFT